MQVCRLICCLPAAFRATELSRALLGADPQRMNCKGVLLIALAAKRSEGKMSSMLRAGSESAPADAAEAEYARHLYL